VPKRYPEEFRRKVLDLVAAGRPVAQIANDLQISDQTIYDWPSRGTSTNSRSVATWDVWLHWGRGERAQEARKPWLKTTGRIESECHVDGRD
jgi:transposase-like protein